MTQAPIMSLMKSHQMAMFSLLILSLSVIHVSGDRNLTGFSFDLIHIDGKNSPFCNKTVAGEKTHQRFHGLSEEYQMLSWKYSGNKTMRRRLLQVRANLVPTYGSQYLVKIGVGTRAVTTWLVLDTGSHLTWTQCKPLQNYFNQPGRVFDPRRSSTYKKVKCSELICRPPLFNCVNNNCVYELNYFDGGTTQGVLSRETVTIDEDRAVSIRNFVFGCSRNTVGDFATTSSGMLSMDRSPFSFAAQLPSHRFSYCLPVSNHLSTYLRFDGDIPRFHDQTLSLPLVQGVATSSYYVNLNGITICGRRLRLPRNTFAQHEGGGGCVLDSGASLTYINRPVYDLIKREVVNYFNGHGLFRATAELRDMMELEVCYFWHEDFQHWPEMVLHFQGGDWTIDSSRLFYTEEENSVTCLALKPSEGITAIGNYQQRNVRIVYDLAAGVVELAHENCDADAHP